MTVDALGEIATERWDRDCVSGDRVCLAAFLAEPTARHRTGSAESLINCARTMARKGHFVTVKVLRRAHTSVGTLEVGCEDTLVNGLQFE